ncbi:MULTISPECIES: DUF3231 family protein [unclassified Paenibacillus]|uniref:DUF3231 family protein n=1 Tax=unclassified Paenibacillus TaxID=185978 RepID=UPI00277D7B12|nr:MULTISPECIES: DUF3231 family protein [unclassified Paenibacillus]MDQ0901985.1 hypothetical protein [Paenibacillus sp. V4I7]MDQ0919518.1 hypothetical protein [Paenibacillus sp. V4I5]
MNSNHVPLTSSEIGNLWMTYQEKTMLLQFLEYFLEHVENDDIQQILKSTYDSSEQIVESIKHIFQQEGAVIPLGFTANDVNKGVPKLFDFLYEPMFLHMISKIEASLFALYSTMSYRKDIRQLFKQLTANAQEMFDQCTQFLLDKGVLVRPPFMTMPKEIAFIKDENYLSGFNLLRETRSLNAIEISLLHHAIETNLTGMQLMIGFAQVANDKKVKEYFVEGMKLSKEVETTLGEYLRQDYIEPPATHAGKATNSTVAPFSDKLMMYITNLLGSFGIGSNALGGAFSLRSDLLVTMARLTQKIIPFVKDGGELMIKNGWMEEPPQVEDRKQLTKT